MTSDSENRPKQAQPWRRALSGGVALIAMGYTAVVLARLVEPGIGYTYVALLVAVLALADFLRASYPGWVLARRSVELSELENLYAEFDRYSARPGGNEPEPEGAAGDQPQAEAERIARQECERLKKLSRPVLEVDALSLRQALVDLYHPSAELVAHTRYELGLFADYILNTEDDDYGDEKKRIEDLFSDLEENEDAARTEQNLRAELKTLRTKVAWLDQTWAIGEWLRQCVTIWVVASGLAMTLIGILPVIHAGGNWNLTVLHWVVLGVAGALFAVLLRIHDLDLPELGETDGKQLVQVTIRSIGLGAAAALLLYLAIWGELLGGKIFPDLPTTSPATPPATVTWDLLKNTGLSALWGFFAGFSPTVLRRVSAALDSGLGDAQNLGSTT